jgi:hypothetical protein
MDGSSSRGDGSGVQARPPAVVSHLLAGVEYGDNEQMFGALPLPPLPVCCGLSSPLGSPAALPLSVVASAAVPSFHNHIPSTNRPVNTGAGTPHRRVGS